MTVPCLAAVLLSLGLSQAPLQTQPLPEGFDVSVGLFASTPERFVVCAGYHPVRRLEVDVCLGAARGLVAATSHVFYRARWFFPWNDSEAGLELALGPGAGLRVMGVCPFSVCEGGAGPEALASLEATQWLSPSFGISLQADAGLAVVWANDGSGTLQHSFRFPARLLLGVSF